MYCFYFRGFKQHKITYRTEKKIIFGGLWPDLPSFGESEERDSKG